MLKLNDTGREKMINYLEEYLRDDINLDDEIVNAWAIDVADQIRNNAVIDDDGDFFCDFEIKARLTKSGNPALVSFDAEDFDGVEEFLSEEQA